MSLESWKKKYIPIDAETALSEAHRLVPVDKARRDLIMVKHAIRKWKGARDSALADHSLCSDYGDIYDYEGDEYFHMGSECCFCKEYAGDNRDDDGRCVGCPLVDIRGVSCDRNLPYEKVQGRKSPWYEWAHGNPRPMLKLLKKAKVLIKKRLRG